jgi:aminoglycoside phosphotransferase (APT) family kinase protein
VGVTDARAIAGRFAVEGDVRSVMSLPGGHINDSYRVDLGGPGEGTSFLLQRLNPHVFPRPDHVMENVTRVTRHIARQGGPTLTLMPTTDGRAWLVDSDGGVWRLFRWVPDSVVHVRAESPAACDACGRAFGEFLRLVGSYDGPPLHETIAGFHDTRARFAQLDTALRTAASQRLADARAEVAAALSARSVGELLPARIDSGALPTRIVHNDAKISNVLFDRSSGAALCVVDLDTVMPGSPLADFGDLVRSCVSPAPEDERDLSLVGVDPARFESLIRGFLEGSGDLLSDAERELLVFAGRWITLEQGVRFLTDYLDGDRYYRVSYPAHNLVRARAQLALYRSLTDQEPGLAKLVARS